MCTTVSSLSYVIVACMHSCPAILEIILICQC